MDDLSGIGATWIAMRDDMSSQPIDVVLQIKRADHECELMTAGGLAGFIPGQRHFGTTYAGAADAV